MGPLRIRRRVSLGCQNLRWTSFIETTLAFSSHLKDYEDEIAKTIEASRAARQHSAPPPSQMTNRTVSGRHSVGGSHLVKMSQTAPYTTTGLSTDFRFES